ncbi:MAG TPA: translation initiation factor IF-3 [Candidatus Saccharimonadales bacterium]|nr:translation initiation factor IF-3 [Candidatus Saccharimonadales bacterium]
MEEKRISIKLRINDRIRAREIRVIDENGVQMGIMSPDAALEVARQRGLDLVEVAPTSAPPVCRILDYGKFIYEQNKKQQEARKKARHIHLKEVKFRPKTDEHDYEFKKNHIVRFLNHGDKVKVVIMFRGRERQYLDRGRKILDRVAKELQEVGIVESPPKYEGHFMSMIMSAKKGATAGEKPARTGASRRGSGNSSSGAAAPR